MMDCGVSQERPSGERRSKQVLDAAELCVRRLGFHNASMAEIAAAAGMSVGHIYRYFPSKEAIIIAIVQRDMAEAVREIEAVETDPRCLRSALMAHVRRVIARLTEPDRVAMVLEVMAEAARNPRIAEVVRTGVDEVHARMFALISRNRAPELSEQALRARMDAFDLVMAGLPLKAVKTPDFDRDATASLAADCIASMVAAEPASVAD
jgi:AcrR family transcriptional regulator